MDLNLVENFCTPPVYPFTEFDSKILNDAEKIELPFEGNILDGYAWGKGKTVLLIHGWGSRASHIAYLGRFIAKSGFRVITYDAPAHSSCFKQMRKTKSNMFEYCRAVSAVEKNIGPLYAVIGHSFGAFCAAFTAAGLLAFKDIKITLDKLLLISVPPSLISIIESFCRNHELDSSGFKELKNSLEEAFNFSADEYCLETALRNISADILFIHDVSDEEFPVSDIHSIHQSIPGSRIFVTEGSGHQKILKNRKMISHVKEFLLNNFNSKVV